MNNMLPDERIIMGAAGTAIGAVGASMSVNEMQAIISIIATVAGFIISVLVPTIIKIVNKVKEAKKDGVITEEEKRDIINEITVGGKKVVDEGKKVVESVKKAKESEKSELESAKEAEVPVEPEKEVSENA